MKILCVSDMIDPMVYNQNVKEIFPDIDLILCAGDLPMDYIDFIVSVFNRPTYFVFGNHNLKEFRFYDKASRNTVMSARDLQKLSDQSHSHGGKYLGFSFDVNHELSYIDPETGKPTPLLIAGVPGSIRYNNGQNQYTDRQMKFKLMKMVPHLWYNKLKYGRYLDILLTHATPRHIHDKEDPCHRGFESFNWFVEKFKPTFMVHGHIHLYDMREERIGKYWDSVLVNAYAHTIIELPLTQEKLKELTEGGNQ
ncbi:MAG: metallophosphoesterase [Treponema sp.]|nr:metallophosphoesterase [Treponema sp.]